MSSEFHLRIVYVAHTSFFLLLALRVCMLPRLALLALSFSFANINRVVSVAVFFKCHCNQSRKFATS